MLGGESPFFFLLVLYGEEGAGIITVPLPKSQQSDGEADKETENRRCQGQHNTVEAVLVNVQVRMHPNSGWLRRYFTGRSHRLISALGLRY